MSRPRRFQRPGDTSPKQLPGGRSALKWSAPEGRAGGGLSYHFAAPPETSLGGKALREELARGATCGAGVLPHRALRPDTRLDLFSRASGGFRVGWSGSTAGEPRFSEGEALEPLPADEDRQGAGQLQMVATGRRRFEGPAAQRYRRRGGDGRGIFTGLGLKIAQQFFGSRPRQGETKSESSADGPVTGGGCFGRD